MKKFFDKWIAIDWGTSFFRAYLIENDKVSDSINTKDGMKFLEKASFEKTLIRLIEPLKLEVLISGP